MQMDCQSHGTRQVNLGLGIDWPDLIHIEVGVGKLVWIGLYVRITKDSWDLGYGDTLAEFGKLC